MTDTRHHPKLRQTLGWTLALLALAAVYMSWGALYDLAVYVGGMSHDRAVVFPAIIDLVTIAAMLLALLVEKASGWAWATLTVFGLFTVAGNAAHVVTVPPGHLALGVMVGTIVNATPAIALLMTTHLAARTVFRPEQNRAAATGTTRKRSAPSRTRRSRNGTARPATASRDAQRNQVLELASQNVSLPEIVLQTGIPKSTVHRWITTTTERDEESA